MNAASMLRPASVDFLYDGMLVIDDIYNFNAAYLLLPAGTVLNAALIEKIKTANRKHDCIYVSEHTYQLMRNNSDISNHMVTISKKLEFETGYAELLDSTSNFMKESIATNNISREEVYSVSSEVAYRLKVTKTDVIFDLINALAPADEYLRRHVVNVSMLNGLMGRWLGLTDGEVKALVLIGLIHDCGKAIIPPEILNAPRRLTLVEFEVMKTHPLYSYSLLSEMPDSIRLGALYHHEKVNGGGYPYNLRGEELPLASRITSVSDVYDAMVSRRVYKEPSSPFSVLSNLSQMRGTSLDPKLVDIFTLKMPQELIGKSVLLSDGTTGSVHHVDPNDIEYPQVLLNDRVVKTSENLHCVSMLCQ